MQRLVPEHTAHDAENARKASVVIGTALACLPIGVLGAAHVFASVDGPIRTPLALLLLGLPLTSGIALALLRSGVRPPLAMHALVGSLLVAFSVLGYFLGGPQGPVQYWLVVLPALFVNTTV